MAKGLSLSRAAGALRGGVCGPPSALEAFSLFSSFERLAAVLAFDAIESIIYRYSGEVEISIDNARARSYERRDRAETARSADVVALAESCHNRCVRVHGTPQINGIDRPGTSTTQLSCLQAVESGEA